MNLKNEINYLQENSDKIYNEKDELINEISLIRKDKLDLLDKLFYLKNSYEK